MVNCVAPASNSATRIHAGFVGIGNERPLQLFGYGERKKMANAARMDLEANWILVSGDAAPAWLMIALDTLYSSIVLEDALRAGFAANGARMPALFVVASHTHYAPALDDTKPGLGAADPGYINDIAHRIVDDVLQTVSNGADLHPESWTHASAESPGAVFRRRKRLTLSARRRPHVQVAVQIAPNPDVQIDREMRLWIARDREKQPLFALVTWPCHATSRSNDGRVSPDFVGIMRQAIREVVAPDLPVLYFPGASGDIRPAFAGFGRGRRLLYPYPLQRSFVRPDPTTLGSFDGMLAKTAQLCASQMGTRLAFGSCGFSSIEVPHADFMADAGDAHMRVTRATLGGIEIDGFGAEVSALWPALLGLDGDRDQRLVTGCVGPCFGYLPTDDQIPEGGYEVNRFRQSFQAAGEYRAEIPIRPALMRTLNRLAASSNTPTAEKQNSPR